MKFYFTLSNVLAFVGLLVFLSTFFVHDTGRSYVAAGTGGAAIMAGFVVFLLVFVHAGIVGLVYATSLKRTGSFIRKISYAVLGAPVLLIVGVIIYHILDDAVYQYQRKQGLDYAVEQMDKGLIRKVVNRDDFESDLSSSTLVKALKAGLAPEALDILVEKHYSGTRVFSKYGVSDGFEEACLNGLIQSGRDDLWPQYLKKFKSHSPDGDYDSEAFHWGVASGNYSVIDYFLANPDTHQWIVDKVLEKKNARYFDYLLRKGIHISHSKHPDLLGYVVDDVGVFDDEFVILYLVKVYRYGPERDNNTDKLLLRIKNYKVLKWLIQRGASILQTDEDGNTFLHKAIMNGVSTVYVRNIYEEYKGGGYLNSINNNGVTIHMLLAEYAPYEAGRVFDDINIDAVDKHNNHFLHYIFKYFTHKEYGSGSYFSLDLLAKIVDEYRARGMAVNTRNSLGVMPMQYALFNTEEYEQLYELGFELEDVNPVSRAFVLVDAFKQFVDFRAEMKEFRSVKYVLRDLEQQLTRLSVQQRDIVLTEMSEYIAGFTRDEETAYDAKVILEELAELKSN